MSGGHHGALRRVTKGAGSGFGHRHMRRFAQRERCDARLPGPVAGERTGLRDPRRAGAAEPVYATEDRPGAQRVAEIHVPGHHLLGRERTTGIAHERGAEILRVVTKHRPRVKVVRAPHYWADRGAGYRSGPDITPERPRIEFVPVTLNALNALNARIHSSGRQGVDRRAFERPHRDLGDDPGYCFSHHFRDCRTNDLGNDCLGAGDQCRHLRGSRPVDPDRRQQRGQTRRQHNQVGDEHLLGEFDLSGRLFDRLRQLSHLTCDLVYRRRIGFEPFDQLVVKLAGRESRKGRLGGGVQISLESRQLVRVVPPPVSLSPTRGFVPFRKRLADQVAYPPQPTRKLDTHGLRAQHQAGSRAGG